MPSADSESDDTFLRFGLLATGVLAWMGGTDLWEFGDVGALPMSVGLLLASYLVGFVLLILACAGNIPRFARYAIPVALLVVVADYFQIHEANARLRGGDLTTDVLLFGEYTAHLLLEGQNPYGADLLEAYRAHRAPFNFSTPQIDGSLVGHLPYPALSFLVIVPALLVGLRASIVYPIFQVAALVALYFGVSPRYRPIILLPFLGETVYMGYALGGVSDPVWGFLLVCMVLAWDRPIGRGLLFGLAVSFKQHPWFLAPFLLVRIIWETKGSRTERIRAALLFTALSVGVFLVVNLPFAIWGPVEWFRGVFLPFLAPMQVYGQGPSVLTTVGWFTIPKSAHTVTVLGLLSIGLLAYARHYPRVPYLLWMVPAVALWFGHRSLTSYWYFLAMPLAIDAFGVRRPVVAPSEAPRRSFVPELALIGVLVAGFVMSAVWGARHQPDLEIAIVGPHEAIGNHISGTRVRVRNGTGGEIEPRFQVQTHFMQPLFWPIKSGPKILQAGQSAVYRIAIDKPQAFVEIARGGRVSVHPAGAHEPRVAARIEGDVSGALPDVAPNGEWKLWTQGQEKPHFWRLLGIPDFSGRVRYAAGRRSRVIFELDDAAGDDFGSLKLDTFMLMPEYPFWIDVRRPRGANHLPDPDIVYGLEFKHGGNTVWVLFGDEEATGRFEPHHFYKVLPAPAEEWSTHKIDVRAIFAELGLRISARRMSMPGFPHLDFPMSPLSFDLMLQARRTEAPLVAQFGKIEWGGGTPDHRAIYRRNAGRPEQLILWKADRAAEMGNEETARQLYLEVLSRKPRLGVAHFGLGKVGLQSGVEPEDVEHFLAAAELGFRPGMSLKGAGWASLRLDQPEAAEAYFRQALILLKEDINLGDAWKGVAVSLDQRGLCPEAIDAAGRARDLHPGVRLKLPGCEDSSGSAERPSDGAP